MNQYVNPYTIFFRGHLTLDALQTSFVEEVRLIANNNSLLVHERTGRILLLTDAYKSKIDETSGH